MSDIVTTRPWHPVTWIIVSICLMGIGAAIFYLSLPEPVQETWQPSIRQADRSLILERKPNPKAKPKQPVPSGARAERVGSVTVQPETAGPVTVDWSLLKLTDNTRRIVASSPDGEVIGGVDVPVDSPIADEPNKWAIGVAGSSSAAGVWLTRDVGRIRVLLMQSAVQPRPGHGLEAHTFIGVGWSF